MSDDDLKDAIGELDSQLEVIGNYRKEYMGLTTSAGDLEADHVILYGLKRLMVLNVIAYYSYHDRFTEGVTIHPESRKVLNELHYNIEHNLPCKKEVRRCVSMPATL